LISSTQALSGYSKTPSILPETIKTTSSKSSSKETGIPVSTPPAAFLNFFMKPDALDGRNRAEKSQIQVSGTLTVFHQFANRYLNRVL
jgi:hypothetical protein